MAKKGQVFRKHSSEFKISVIMDMRDNHLGMMETERKYKVNHHVIARWERIYLEEGAEGLMKERRGRACSAGGTRKGRPPKLDKQAEEMFSRLVKQMTEREGVTEQLKANNQIEWVVRMNNIRCRATKLVNSELIYS